VVLSGGGSTGHPVTTAGGGPSGSGARRPSGSASLAATTTTPTATNTAATTTTTAPAMTLSPTTTVNAGALPQTDALPAAGAAPFPAEMSALWNGIVTNSASTALAAFFPEQAYLQVKTLSDDQSDYQNRLVGGYSMDITAAHDLLGPDPSSATLVSVNVPASYAHWVPPGTCSNGVGYYEVANSRVVYQQGGVTRSFGIASLISWRGVWYVVHLGAIDRSSDAGVVLDPETGPGASPPSSTC
jgi:hypothetical protein